MPRNGSGQYNPLTNTWNPPVTGVLATGADFQAQLNDISAAITQSVSKDGQTPMTANLPMGNNSIVGISSGTQTSPSISANGDTNTGVYFPAADTVAIATGGVKQVEVDANGNVGLGVTPSVWGGPNRGVIDLGTAGSVFASTSVGTTTAYNAYYNGTNWIYKGVGGGATRYTSTSVYHAWYIAPSGTAGNAITWTQAMTLDANENLLVGLTAAQVGERLSIRGSGTTLAYFDQTTNTSGYSGIWVNIEQNGNNTSTYHFKGETTGINSWYLYGNGTTSYSSDSRLKKNIETARNGYLDDLMKLRVVKYNWNSHQDGTPKELGLIAQEVEEVFPNLIQEHEIQGVDGPRKHIKHSVMEFILIKAIQEQQALIEAQKTAIESLTARITALEAK